MSKILSLAAISIIFAPYAQVFAAEHYISPDYSGSINEYREYIIANDLHKLCKGEQIDNNQLTWKPYKDYSESKEMKMVLKDYLTEFCTGYIAAVAEAYDNWTGKGGWKFCLRANVSNQVIRENVNEYIVKHKEHANHTAVSVISSALSKTYTCNQETDKRDRVYLAASQLLIDCNASNKGFCTGYIQGVIDAYDNWETRSGERFCGVGYRLWYSTWQLFNTMGNIYNLEKHSALDIVTASIEHTCNVSIERNLGCLDPVRCKGK
jgi:hypothetical protein